MRPSLLLLLAANAVPLFGSLFLGWSVGSILALYWAETAVIGALTVVKILTAGERWSLAQLPARLFLALFFCFHFGLFLLVHGAFAGGIAASAAGQAGLGPGGGLLAGPRFLLASLAGGPWLALGGLGASHGLSLVLNFLDRERRVMTPKDAMLQPYGRVIVMHVVVLGGSLLALVAGVHAAVVLLLVVAKTALDASAHTAEHRGLERLAAGSLEQKPLGPA